MASARRLRTTRTIARLLPAYVAFALAKRVIALGTLARWAWRPARRPRDPLDERHVLACVVRLDRLMGRPDGGCLQRSLLLYRELSRLGSNPVLCVGFRRMAAGGAAPALHGHAWVEVDGRSLLEDAGSLEGLERTFSYAAKGARVSDQRTFSITSAASSSSSMN